MSTTQAQAIAAIASLQALPNPGPGLSANLARLNDHLNDGNNGTDPNAYAQIVIEVNRYLAFPV
jgi:hypothetical protein